MAKIIGIADCNNFYVSCERVFNPSLKDKPVLVLSNNDGNAITSNNITIRIKKIFKEETGKSISPSHLRSIYISEYYAQNISIKKKQLLAWQMGHTKNCADLNYNKIDLYE
jgi:DNA polymerase V